MDGMCADSDKFMQSWMKVEKQFSNLSIMISFLISSLRVKCKWNVNRIVLIEHHQMLNTNSQSDIPSIHPSTDDFGRM